MKNPNNNKHSWRIVRAVVLLLVLSFIWLIGWTLCWVGDQKMNQSAPHENTDAFKTRAFERKDLNEVTQQIVA